MCVAVSAAFNLSATKLVSSAFDFQKQIMRLCLKASVLTSLFFTIIFYIFAKQIATFWIGYPQTDSCIKILCFGLVFVSASSCLKGYFTACRKVSVCSNSQFFEQFVRMSVVFSLLSHMKNNDIYACCRAVVFANAISELAAFTFLYIAYKRQNKYLPLPAKRKYPLLKNFFSTFFPITVSNYANSALHTVENLIVPNALFKYTASKTLSVSLFGMIKGMAIPVIFFPASFLNAISTLLLPEISSMSENKNAKSINKTLSLTIQLTLLSSFGIAAMFFVCSYDISALLYKSRETGKFMQFLSLIIPFMYTESVICGTLCALNLQNIYMRFNIYNSIIRTAAILFFVPNYGIDAFVGIMIASNIFTSASSFIWLYRKTHFYIDIKNFFIKPILSAIFAASVGMYVSFFCKSLFISTFLRCGLILSIYCIILLLIKAFNPTTLKPLCQKH